MMCQITQKNTLCLAAFILILQVGCGGDGEGMVGEGGYETKEPAEISPAMEAESTTTTRDIEGTIGASPMSDDSNRPSNICDTDSDGDVDYADFEDSDHEGKIHICHVPDGDLSKENTLSVSISGWEGGHADHEGNYLGECGAGGENCELTEDTDDDAGDNGEDDEKVDGGDDNEEANVSDGVADAGNDSDDDGIADCDNCPNTAVEDQEEADDDTVGDIVTVPYVSHFVGPLGIVGSDEGYLGTDYDTGGEVRFDYAQGITSDGTYLYVADSGNATVRKIEIETGIVTTIAGAINQRGYADGTGAVARFYQPSGITIVGDNLYVTDPGNYTIRKIVIATGEVTTVAGTAGDPTPAGGGGFNDPQGIASDGTNLYVTDGFGSKIRKIEIATGTVTTFAGSGGGTDNTDGIGTAAQFYKPYGIICDGDNLYVTDQLNSNIRQLDIATREVTTIAEGFNRPRGITSDGADLYVADTDSHTIRKIEIDTGAVTTFAGVAGLYGATDGIATSSTFYNPYALTFVGTSLYVTEHNNDVRLIE